MDKVDDKASGRVAGYYLVLQKGKAVQILNWRESNLPLERKHWTVAYLTPSNISGALPGFSGTSRVN